MKKRNDFWTIKHLVDQYEQIEFPEFQREPTIWDLDKKQKLIDSILRDFDIATIYLHKRDEAYECIDGRQRLNAVLSYLGLAADEGSDPRVFNLFAFKSSNELNQTDTLEEYNGKRWTELDPLQKDKILRYKFNVLEVSDVSATDSSELNLMFLRLQLGAPLNAGEKLNAMLGEMKQFIFDKAGKHPFFAFLRIPQRRYSKELTAAQLALNFFAQQSGQDYHTTRFVDLQDFFRANVKLDKTQRETAKLMMSRLDQAYTSIQESDLVLKNRAVAITTFFYLSQLLEKRAGKGRIESFVTFLKLFLQTLHDEVKKGIGSDPRYRDLLQFQTYVSQAAVEKYAFERRLKLLDEYFKYYLDHDAIKTVN